MAIFVPISIQNLQFFSNLEVCKNKTTRSRFLKIASNIKKGYIHNISKNKNILRSQFLENCIFVQTSS